MTVAEFNELLDGYLRRRELEERHDAAFTAAIIQCWTTRGTRVTIEDLVGPRRFTLDEAAPERRRRGETKVVTPGTAEFEEMLRGLAPEIQARIRARAEGKTPSLRHSATS